MKSNKTIRKKFRMDTITNESFQKILSYKKISMQSVMESLVKEYICKNLDTLINKDN